MIDSLVSAGPPVAGLPNLRESKRSQDQAEKGTFEGVLESRVQKKEPVKEPDSRQTSGDKTSDPPRDRVTKSEDRSKEGAKKEKPEEGKQAQNYEVAKGAPKKESRTRQQAIEEFMDSFESELGIPATRLVASIAELSPKEKLAAPEVTAEKVVAGLDLKSEEDRATAQALYASLLVKLDTASDQQRMPEIVPKADPALLTQHKSAKALEMKNRQAGMNASVENITRSFWEKPQVPSDSTVVGKMPLESESPLGMKKFESPDMALKNLSSSEMEIPLTEDIQSITVKPVTPQNIKGEIQKQTPKGIPVEDLSPLALSGMIVKKDQQEALQGLKESSRPSASLVKEAKGEFEGLKELMQELGLQGADANASPFPGEAGGGSSFPQPENPERTKEDFKLKSADLDSSQLLAESGDATKGLGKLSDGKFEALIPSTAPALPTPKESEINNQQILNQAKYLMSKGGGEVTVKMTPEGMGTVHLKVMMQDGKMQIQMDADNKSAKSALESSLADLKTSLAAQKLSVDNIKVDVVNAASNDTATQNQMNDHQGQREARQFWNSFNENFGNQARRNTFFDSPTGRGYKTKGPQPLEPIQASTSTAKPREVSGKGSGLNLVA